MDQLYYRKTIKTIAIHPLIGRSIVLYEREIQIIVLTMHGKYSHIIDEFRHFLLCHKTDLEIIDLLYNWQYYIPGFSIILYLLFAVIKNRRLEYEFKN